MLKISQTTANRLVDIATRSTDCACDYCMEARATIAAEKITGPEQKLVKCRFCDWTRPLWYKANGRTRSGWDKLRDHVGDAHPMEAKQIDSSLG
jgi:hypothetical protein